MTCGKKSQIGSLHVYISLLLAVGAVQTSSVIFFMSAIPNKALRR